MQELQLDMSFWDCRQNIPQFQEIQNLKRYGKSEIDDFGVDDDVLSMNDFDGLYEDEPMEAKSNHAMKMAKSIGKMLKPVKKSEEEKADKEDKK